MVGSSGVRHGAERVLVDLWLHNLPQIGGGVTGRTAEKRGTSLSDNVLQFLTSFFLLLRIDRFSLVLLLQDCLLCPTGFSANTAVMTALGSISSLLSAGRKPAEDERIAIFSDALNHASTIDGIRLVERQQEAVAFVYKHRDMSHLDSLLYVFFSYWQ